ncbi:MAG: hypothetical protein JXA81_07575 [Sedimentisphaerales bacterium]|nr:hypothetical protein [Sedimentisphaerales bacterium]
MKELVLGIMGFVLLLTIFCTVVLTSSWADKDADKQIVCTSSAVNESEPGSASMQGPINHFSDIRKESEPDATFSGRTCNNADEPEPAFASPHYRINYHRVDPNDLKDPDALKDSLARKNSFARNGSVTRKNDYEDADDVVE